jgi:hypothetical protein
VASIARPGGNVTGFTYYEGEMAGKWMELLKEVLVSRVMVILNPANPAWPKFMEATNAAAAKFAVEAVSASVRDAAGIERAFETFAREPTTTSRSLLASCWFCCRTAINFRLSRPYSRAVGLPGDAGKLLVNLLSEDHSQANERGKHTLMLEAYAYRWYRVGGLDYLLKRSDIDTDATGKASHPA